MIKYPATMQEMRCSPEWARRRVLKYTYLIEEGVVHE